MEKNQFHLKKIKKNENRIEYDYEIKGPAKKYFDLNNKLFIEYENYNIEQVPDGIAAIPLLANILPIAWLTDMDLFVDELDVNFLESIPDLLQGYKDMYPQFNFYHNITVENICDYKVQSSGKSMCFFTGGVDSTSSLINVMDESPDLVTLWGSDIKLDDQIGWETVRNSLTQVAKNYSLNNIFIKTNFRSFISYSELNNDFSKDLNDNWWQGLQHGIGIISHVAPQVYLEKIEFIYFPASHSVKDENVKHASYPTINDKMKISTAGIYHEGFELDRQERLRNICNYKNKTHEKIELRVCYSSRGGGNCGKCEKCSRTIMGIIAEGYDPNDFDLDFSPEVYKDIKFKLKYKWYLGPTQVEFWEGIQNQFINNTKLLPEIEWFYIIDFDKINNNFLKKLRHTAKSNTKILEMYLKLKGA